MLFTMMAGVASFFLKSSKLMSTNARIRQASSAGVSATERLWRSFLYVPGDQEKKILKIAKLCDAPLINPAIPDVVVLDCEDSVSSDNKECARKSVAGSIQRMSFQEYRTRLKRSVCIRINPPSTGLAGDDLHIVLSACVETMNASGGEWPGPDYIAVPKMESIRELQWVDSEVSKIFEKHSVTQIPSMGLIALVESPKSLMGMRDLCKSATRSLKMPLVAVVFGSDDYCASLGVVHTEGRQETLFARQYMVTMCRAHGLAAIDMVETDINDMIKFQQNCRLGAQFGYSGKQLIHPGQVECANVEFSPSAESIEWASALVEAAAAQGNRTTSGGGVSTVPIEKAKALAAGAFSFRGHMIDRPTVLQARRVVQLSRLIKGT